MKVQSIARWQWVILGVLLGLGLWSARRPDGQLPLAGESLNNQHTFEQRLFSRIGGQPLFKDVAVSRHVIAADSAHPQPVYLVTGKTCDGTVKPDGKYHWNSAFYVARVPYRPTNAAASFGVKLDSSLVFPRAGNEKTVVDFLRAAREAGNVQFSNAWWRTYPFWTWFDGSVLIVGILWPCVIDLIVYGRLIRPREKRPVSLVGVKGTSAAKIPASTFASQTGTDDQAIDTQQPVADVAPVASTASVVRPLASDTPKAPVDDVKDHPSFQAKPEDYYPTEQRRKSKPDPAK